MLTQVKKRMVSAKQSQVCCNEKDHQDVHVLGLSLLYTDPSRLIISPKIMNVAASKGVGAIIVAQILSCTHNQLGQNPVKKRIRTH